MICIEPRKGVTTLKCKNSCYFTANTYFVAETIYENFDLYLMNLLYWSLFLFYCSKKLFFTLPSNRSATTDCKNCDGALSARKYAVFVAFIRLEKKALIAHIASGNWPDRVEAKSAIVHPDPSQFSWPMQIALPHNLGQPLDSLPLAPTSCDMHRASVHRNCAGGASGI